MKSLKLSLIGVLCGAGIACWSGSVLADTATTSQAPSANGQIHLAGWWWDDNDWRDRRDWRYYHDRQRWCENHPRKCREIRRHHREWCRNHPYKCDRGYYY